MIRVLTSAGILRYNPLCWQDGAWLSLVEHLAWDQGVAGSNPAAPTIYCQYKMRV